jgi:hypothetical protein
MDLVHPTCMKVRFYSKPVGVNFFAQLPTQGADSVESPPRHKSPLTLETDSLDSFGLSGVYNAFGPVLFIDYSGF